MKNIIGWLLTKVNNFLTGESREFIPAEKKLYIFTFYLVGLDKTAIVISTNRDRAARKVYDALSDEEIEKIEWADLVQQIEMGE